MIDTVAALAIEFAEGLAAQLALAEPSQEAIDALAKDIKARSDALIAAMLGKE